jgi:hypothetical protein
MKNILAFIGILILLLPLRAQTKPDGTAPQFLFEDFSTGKVKMKNGNIQTIVLNYNTVSEKMVYEKDNKLYDMINTEMIDTVSIAESKFIPVGKAFYEILLVAPLTLFVEYIGEVLPPGAPAGYGPPSQVSNTKYMTSANFSMGYYNLKLPKDYTVKLDWLFWIRKDDSMLSFATEKQFLKLFPDKEGVFKKYIKQNRIKFDKLQNVVSLIQYCNEVMK